MSLELRRLAGREVTAIGYGCMNLSHGYGPAQPDEAAAALIRRALELGVTHFDTAALYAFGENERLVGRALANRPAHVLLATKGGAFGRDGKRVIDGSPDSIRANCEQSLRNLGLDCIDLYYLHRWDKRVPIEDSVGALAALVAAGKVRAIGLSEVSVATLRRAHAVHPVAAVQSEYSLWTRNAELGVLEETRRIGAAYVAFSPLGRGWLTDTPPLPGRFAAGDIRSAMPRFQAANFQKNEPLHVALGALAREAGCTSAQLAIAWVLSRGAHVLTIPGTTRLAHLEANVAAGAVRLDASLRARLEALFTPGAIAGGRYPDSSQAEIDTEQFV
jgi:aryl-alcohol dehydrogenase-like predicted oxidoreductase